MELFRKFFIVYVIILLSIISLILSSNINVNATSSPILNNTSNTTISNTILTVYGLPAGSSFIWRMAPNYTTITTPITGYTTRIPIYINHSTNSTYHGAIPWQYQGIGTTVSYNSVTYTMLTNTSGTCSTQIISSNGLNNFCSFYVYLNSSLWTTNESAELKASNASLSSTKIVVKSITNKSTSAYYNGTTPAGNVIKSALDKNGAFNFISTNITKQPSYICINLTSTLGNWNFCNPGKYTLPLTIYKGHFGLSNISSVNITAHLSSALYGSQKVPYSATIENGNSTIMLIFNQSASGFSQSDTFTYTAGKSLFIILNGGGNANYSVDDPEIDTPANVLNYTLGTFNSGWSSVSSNTVQQRINLYENNAIYGNYIAYNGTSTNIELANPSTGALYDSWIESNVLGNLTIWVAVPNSIALSNSILLGFTKKSQNVLTSGIGTGEAPQLSSTYAEYDDGANVFPDYWNFAGTILPSNLVAGEFNGGSGSYTQNNGITFGSGINAGYGVFTNFALSGNYAVDTLGYTTAAGGGTGARPALIFTASSDSNPNYIAIDQGGYGLNAWVVYGDNAGTTTNYGSFGTTLNANQNFQISSMVSGSSDEIAAYPQGTAAYTYSTYTTTFYGGYIGIGTEKTPINDITFYWLRTRAYPPNGVMPSVSFSSVQQVYTSPTISNSIVSNSIIDQRQTSIITNNGLTGGTTPYTYQWFASLGGIPTLTSANALEANTLLGSSAQTDTANFITNTLTTSGKYYFILQGTDAHPTSVNSIAVNVTVFPAPSAVLSVNPSNSLIYPNSATINAIITGGSGKFNVSFTINNKNYNMTKESNTLFEYSNIFGVGTYALSANIMDTGIHSPETTITSNVLNVLMGQPSLTMRFVSPNVQAFTLSNNQTRNVSTAQNFTIFLTSSQYNVLTGNLYMFLLINGNTSKRAYINGTIINGTNYTKAIELSTTNQNNALFFLNKGIYELLYNTSGNDNFSATHEIIYLNQTQTATHTSAIGKGGGIINNVHVLNNTTTQNTTSNQTNQTLTLSNVQTVMCSQINPIVCFYGLSLPISLTSISVNSNFVLNIKIWWIVLIIDIIGLIISAIKVRRYSIYKLFIIMELAILIILIVLWLATMSGVFGV